VLLEVEPRVLQALLDQEEQLVVGLLEPPVPLDLLVLLVAVLLDLLEQLEPQVILVLLEPLVAVLLEPQVLLAPQVPLD
jgi:hypothetical protein